MRAGAELGLAVEVHQSDAEAELIGWLHRAADERLPVVLNPAGLSHTSIVLRDAVAARTAPLVEVHISNIAAREEFRQHSYVSAVASGVITGLGVEGYVLALSWLSSTTAGPVAEPARPANRLRGVQRWRGLDEIPAGWGRCVATIGVFDGLHRGHQQIIARARQLAAERGLPTVLVTFTPHPSEVVRPGQPPAAADHQHPQGRAGGRTRRRRGGVPAVHAGVLQAQPRGVHPRGGGRRAACRRGDGRGELPVRPQGRRRRGDAGRAGPPLGLRRRGRDAAGRGRPADLLDLHPLLRRGR